MKQYIDGYVIPIPKNKLVQYKKIASLSGKLWMKHGALQYVETVLDQKDENPFCVPFMKLPILKAGETVVFSFIVFKSVAHRKKVNTAVYKDSQMKALLEQSMKLCDAKRMVYNGFEIIVNL